MAQLAHDADVPVHVLAPEASLGSRCAPDASHLVLDLRSAAELGSASRARLNPPFDIVPARLVSAYVSERIVVSAAVQGAALMATAARSGAAGDRQRAIEVARHRATAQLLRTFLEQDRLRAAYAICDLDEKEFHKTKWGVAH